MKTLMSIVILAFCSPIVAQAVKSPRIRSNQSRRSLRGHGRWSKPHRMVGDGTGDTKRMRSTLVLVPFLLLPATAFADSVSPGFSRVPHDMVIDVAKEYPNYRFWLASFRRIEPLNMVPGQPCRVDGKGRDRFARIAFVIAAPVGNIEHLIETMGAAKLFDELYGGGLPAGVLRSNQIDLYGAVPFYDNRERVIDRYRLEIDQVNGLSLMWVEQNEGDWQAKLGWAVAGVCVAVSIAWAGWRLTIIARRRLVRTFHRRR